MKKKFFTLTLVFAMLFCTLLTGGCGNSGDPVSIYPVLSAESAKPGDTVQVAVYIDNADRFCSADFYLSYDAQYMTFVNTVSENVTDLMFELTNGADSAGNAFVKFTGLTLKTLDMDECKLFTAEFVVREDAPAGEPFFGIAVGEYYKGEDAEGVKTTNIVSEVVEGGAKLAVTVG